MSGKDASDPLLPVRMLWAASGRTTHRQCLGQRDHLSPHTGGPEVGHAGSPRLASAKPASQRFWSLFRVTRWLPQSCNQKGGWDSEPLAACRQGGGRQGRRALGQVLGLYPTATPSTLRAQVRSSCKTSGVPSLPLGCRESWRILPGVLPPALPCVV